MIDLPTLLTIVLMALTTYLMRILGFLALRNKTLGPRMIYVLESVPGCVLISVIAPAFVANNPADLAALAVTLLAAITLPLLPTVVLGIIASGSLRALM
ncbi:AzlD family protein [Methylobacillus sp.]|uniref:AzlD family protein n=1 Tax=Methylobacillus sp. TaxID=56818 RepID=UPI002FE00A1F